MATGGGEPSRSGEVKFWDVASGNLVRSLDALHTDTVFALRFSPDGSKLATGSADKLLKVIRAEDGKDLKSFEGHTHHVLAVDWSLDGKQLVTGGADNVLKVWDFEAGEQLRTLSAAGKQVTAVRWVPGKPLVAGASGDSKVRYWDPTERDEGRPDLRRARAITCTRSPHRSTASSSPPAGPTGRCSSGMATMARSSANWRRRGRICPRRE